MNKFILLSTLGALGAALHTPLLSALPEDAEQEILISSQRSEMFLDQGRVVYYGEPGEPAEITQGSLKISGQELIVERDNGELRRVTAIGEPARFQQQPEVDQAVVHASGRTIVFDNAARRLSIEDEASFSQEGTGTTSGQRLEYDMDTRRISGAGGVTTTIPPQARDGQNAQ